MPSSSYHLILYSKRYDVVKNYENFNKPTMKTKTMGKLNFHYYDIFTRKASHRGLIYTAKIGEQKKVFHFYYLSSIVDFRTRYHDDEKRRESVLCFVSSFEYFTTSCISDIARIDCRAKAFGSSHLPLIHIFSPFFYYRWTIYFTSHWKLWNARMFSVQFSLLDGSILTLLCALLHGSILCSHKGEWEKMMMWWGTFHADKTHRRHELWWSNCVFQFALSHLAPSSGSPFSQTYFVDLHTLSHLTSPSCEMTLLATERDDKENTTSHRMRVRWNLFTFYRAPEFSDKWTNGCV